MANTGTAEEKKPDEVVPEPEAVDLTTPPEGYTDEEWAELSDTERAALLEPEDTGEEAPEEEPAKEELTEEQQAKIAEDEGKTPEEIEAERVAAEALAAEKPSVVEEVAKPEEVPVMTDEELLSYRPVIDESKLPAPEPEVISPELQTKLEALDKKYDDGDMKLTEYNRERDTINRQINIENYTKNQNMRSEARVNLEYKACQSAFWKAHPEYVENSPKGKAMWGALNATVQSLPEPAGMAVLVKAHKAVKELFGMAVVVPEKKPVTPVVKPKGKPSAQLPDVKTLLDVPEAKANLTTGPFTVLDGLTGEAFEDALEKLARDNPVAYEAYQRGR